MHPCMHWGMHQVGGPAHHCLQFKFGVVFVSDKCKSNIQTLFSSVWSLATLEEFTRLLSCWMLHYVHQLIVIYICYITVIFGCCLQLNMQYTIYSIQGDFAFKTNSESETHYEALHSWEELQLQVMVLCFWFHYSC